MSCIIKSTGLTNQYPVLLKYLLSLKFDQPAISFVREMYLSSHTPLWGFLHVVIRILLEPGFAHDHEFKLIGNNFGQRNSTSLSTPFARCIIYLRKLILVDQDLDRWVYD